MQENRKSRLNGSQRNPLLTKTEANVTHSGIYHIRHTMLYREIIHWCLFKTRIIKAKKWEEIKI